MLISGGNYFNPVSFNKVCKELERGGTVDLVIDCIGHTLNNNEQEVYKEKLQAKYRDNLMIDKLDGAYSYTYSYRLKYFAGGGDNAEVYS